MKVKMKLAIYLLALGSSVLTGCASIVDGSNQVISVETLSKADSVQGATCKLDNGKGVYYVTTPGTVTVHRAYDDMIVKCDKTDYQSGIATVKSNTKGMAFGNILFGGFIGAGVDAATGAAYDYPPLIKVMMGKSITIAPPSKPDSSVEPAPSAASASVSKEAPPVAAK